MIASAEEIAAAKQYLRVENSIDDEMIGDLIDTAMEHVEQQTGIVTAPVSRDFYFPSFGAVIELPVRPVRAVTAVSYSDQVTGLEVVLNGFDWRFRVMGERSLIYPPFGGQWSYTQPTAGEVKVTADVGYAFAEQVPPLVTLAVKKLVTTWYDDRASTTIPAQVDRLLAGFRRTLL